MPLTLSTVSITDCVACYGMILRCHLRIGKLLPGAARSGVPVAELRSARDGRSLSHWSQRKAKDELHDVIIVGGGIIGLTTAREVISRHPQLTVAVVEKEREVGAHQTGHNSGVIHAGLYYEPGSDMAKTCVRGAKLMYDYCEENSLPYERCGKLIVACDEDEHASVTSLHQRGTSNGVKGLEVWSSSDVRRAEPAVERAFSALWSPETGIADFGEVAKCVQSEVERSGQVDVHLACEVGSFKAIKGAADKAEGHYIEVTGREPGQPGPAKVLRGRAVITCAGLHADRISQLAGGAALPKISSFRGSYYQMKPQYDRIVRANIYPVPPRAAGIPVGIHFTPTVNVRRGRSVIIGPGACPTFAREGYRFGDVGGRDLLDMACNRGLRRFVMKHPGQCVEEMAKDLSRRRFMQAARRLLPAVTEEMVQESFAGVMCQVFDDSTGVAAGDYVFERGCMGGRVLNVRNAPSPACTAAFAIAERIVDIAQEEFTWWRR